MYIVEDIHQDWLINISEKVLISSPIEETYLLVADVSITTCYLSQRDEDGLRKPSQLGSNPQT